MSATTTVIERSSIDDFLAGTRIALIGASPDPKNFASTVQRELTAHGYDMVPVNPSHDTVAGQVCYPDVGVLADPVDRAIVMVPSKSAPEAVRQCIDAGVSKIWLFKGIGSEGATSAAATALCRDANVELIDGACPLMFVEPARWMHQVHRRIRERRCAITKFRGLR
jgi:predicted CoA-binding protein